MKYAIPFQVCGLFSLNNRASTVLVCAHVLTVEPQREIACQSSRDNKPLRKVPQQSTPSTTDTHENLLALDWYLVQVVPK